MHIKPTTAWIVLSVLTWLGGSALNRGNEFRYILILIGGASFLLAIGYVSTPSKSGFGKILFGFVVLMVAGINMKIFHLSPSNELIIAALVGIAITYAVMWSRKNNK